MVENKWLKAKDTALLMALSSYLSFLPYAQLHHPLLARPLLVASSFNPTKTQSKQHQPQWKKPGVLEGFGRAALASALGIALSLAGTGGAAARLEGVNRPELLPPYYTPVIDTAGFLSPGQEGRITKAVLDLEEETGFKLRVLAQNYPNTPGLAIKDYWQVDDNTIVFVADPSLGGNILKFNVGAIVDLNVPRNFWARLAGKYGNIFYWQEKGEDSAIESAVSAISACLREVPGAQACSNIQ